MNINNIISLAKHAKGVDEYYESFRLLQSDLDFFKMYLARDKKSPGFWFKVEEATVARHAAEDSYFGDFSFRKSRGE